MANAIDEILITLGALMVFSGVAQISTHENLNKIQNYNTVVVHHEHNSKV